MWNLRADPGEQHNLRGQTDADAIASGLVRTAHRKLREFEGASALGEAGEGVLPEALERQLRSLGYLSPPTEEGK